MAVNDTKGPDKHLVADIMSELSSVLLNQH